MEQKEISIKDLYQIVRKHIFTMITTVLVGVVIAVLVMTFFVTPKYSSEAQLLVNQQSGSNQTAIQNNEIQANIQLINTYRDIITGQSVLVQVNQNLGNKYTPGYLKDAIKVNQSSDSQAFNVSVTVERPEEAQEILNEVITVFEEMIQQVYTNSLPNIFVLSPATFNPSKVSPKLAVFVFVGAFIGLVLSILLVAVIELMDTTVKDDEFLTQLGIINLGHVYELTGKELKQTRLQNSSKLKRSRERI